ncbi:MAG: prepilin peptidase [Clostridium sp.]|nr:prepilin peptidase [Clostridium sp.]
MEQKIFGLAALGLAAMGLATDLRDHKIYNKLTLPSMAAGLLAGLVFSGPGGLMSGVLGILMASLSLICWFLGVLKAGDVKLYMAVGAWTGWQFTGLVLISSMLSGGAAAACLMLFRKNGRRTFRRLWEYVKNLVMARNFYPYEPENSQGYLSFGACIFCGVLWTFWYLYMR